MIELIFYSCMAVFGLYVLWLGITIAKMTDEEYSRHRNLILHPEEDFLGNTTTSIVMDKDGNIIKRVRCSLGATKRLLHKVWDR